MTDSADIFGLSNPEKYMQMALDEAEKGIGKVFSNPLVGAVLTDSQGNVISTGYHREFGASHAEADCLEKIETVPEGAVLFITLEPCCYHSKTPPCDEKIIARGIRKVVVGIRDANKKVNGKGIERLKNAGVDVIEGLMKDECAFINRCFFKTIVESETYISVKSAITLDGKIAMPDGESEWISCEESRKYAHYLRSFYGYVAVGKNTLLTDDPRLDNRFYPAMEQPGAIVFWGRGTIPENLNLLNNSNAKRVYFLVDSDFDCKAYKSKESFRNVKFLSLDRAEMKSLNRLLFENGINSLMVEGGDGIVSGLLNHDCIDLLHTVVTPKIIGRKDAVSWCSNLNTGALSEAVKVNFQNVRRLDTDIEIISLLKKHHGMPDDPKNSDQNFKNL